MQFQYTFEKNKGIVPAKKKIVVKNFYKEKFENLFRIYESCFKNINTHLAYEIWEREKKLRMNETFAQV